MITNSKQNWQIGQTVKVGFISATVKKIDSNGDYLLESVNGKQYAFTPHNGIRLASF